MFKVFVYKDDTYCILSILKSRYDFKIYKWTLFRKVTNRTSRKKRNFGFHFCAIGSGFWSVVSPTYKMSIEYLKIIIK